MVAGKRKRSASTRPRGWKDIRQETKGIRLRSQFAWNRKLMRVAKGIGLFSTTASLVALAWLAPKWYSERGHPIDLTGPSHSVAKVQFSSDGALDVRWFSNWISIKQSQSLMEVDIHELRRELEMIRQVESAEVRRFFPDALQVKLKERRPILKLNTRRPDQEIEEYLVSAEGIVFKPQNFKPTVLENLPFLLPATSLVETAEGIEPIEGVAQVCKLLDLARRNYPSIYRDWKVVSFDRLGPGFEGDPGAYVLINSRKVKSLRFGPDNFPDQMKRLKYLLHERSVEGVSQVASIDLSLGRSVFVKTK